jgi:beta-carotene hydroxylase
MTLPTELTHAQAIKLARSHEPLVAWPTIALALLVSLGFAAVAYFTATDQLPIWLGFAINTLLAYAAYTPVHEACHRNVVDAKHTRAWANDAVGVLAAFPLLGSFHLHQLTHLAHHAHTNDPDKDPDHVMACANIWGLLGRSLLLPFVHMVKGVQMARARSDGAQRLLWGGVQMGVALAAVAWLASLGNPAAALVCTVGSALGAGMLLAVVFDWLPHHPHTSRERWEHTRVVTFPVLVQRTVDAALLGQSYHLVHHLYPRVPYYQYKSVFTQLRGFFDANGALIQPWQQAGFGVKRSLN